MRFRKLRIAFSATCGIACLLLIVLWVRSYSIHRQFAWPGGIDEVSDQGYVTFVRIDQDDLREMMRNPETERMGKATRILRAPYWSLVLVSAALAIGPWLRYRFSLRTLLIATTLAAVVLGLIVWAASR
jgi:hypothetical protein